MFLRSIIFACSCWFIAQLHASSINQTQNQLKLLDKKINNLQNELAHGRNKRELLNSELKNTELKITKIKQQLQLIQTSINTHEKKSTQLVRQIKQLKKQVTTHQLLLTSHVRARYQMGQYQPLKWLLNQDNPYKINQILTYYQYLIHSRQQLIKKIDFAQNKLNKKQQKLDQVLFENHQLEKTLMMQQKQLKLNKKYHATLITALNEEIQNNENSLLNTQRNKENLSRLLKSLAQHSVTLNHKSFNQMRKKLPLPVHTAQRTMRRMNQGLTFFADEGTIVTAVHPGKVVFSNWLNGYGFLMIIDHGQGFMTLYAYNQSLSKHKGQTVHQNEPIARVGHSGAIKQNGLYFEVRLRGKAISPLDWLSSGI